MYKVIDIICERDGLTFDEAKDLIKEYQGYRDWCLENGDFEEAYYAIESMLGLEPDYVMELL